MGQLTEEQHEKAFEGEMEVFGYYPRKWEHLTESQRENARKSHYAMAPHLQFDVLTECDPPSEEEFRQVFESCMRTSSRQALIDLFKGRADKNKALAKRIAELEAEIAALKESPTEFTPEMLERVSDEIMGCGIDQLYAKRVIYRLSPKPKTPEDRITVEQSETNGYWWVMKDGRTVEREFENEENADALRLGLIAQLKAEGGAK